MLNKFFSFLESITTPENEFVIESCKEAFSLCEADEGLSDTSSKGVEFKRYLDMSLPELEHEVENGNTNANLAIYINKYITASDELKSAKLNAASVDIDDVEAEAEASARVNEANNKLKQAIADVVNAAEKDPSVLPGYRDAISLTGHRIKTRKVAETQVAKVRKEISAIQRKIDKLGKTTEVDRDTPELWTPEVKELYSQLTDKEEELKFLAQRVRDNDVDVYQKVGGLLHQVSKSVSTSSPQPSVIPMDVVRQSSKKTSSVNKDDQKVADVAEQAARARRERTRLKANDMIGEIEAAIPPSLLYEKGQTRVGRTKSVMMDGTPIPERLRDSLYARAAGGKMIDGVQYAKDEPDVPLYKTINIDAEYADVEDVVTGEQNGLPKYTAKWVGVPAGTTVSPIASELGKVFNVARAKIRELGSKTSTTSDEYVEVFADLKKDIVDNGLMDAGEVETIFTACDKNLNASEAELAKEDEEAALASQKEKELTGAVRVSGMVKNRKYDRDVKVSQSVKISQIKRLISDGINNIIGEARKSSAPYSVANARIGVNVPAFNYNGVELDASEADIDRLIGLAVDKYLATGKLTAEQQNDPAVMAKLRSSIAAKFFPSRSVVFDPKAVNGSVRLTVRVGDTAMAVTVPRSILYAMKTGAFTISEITDEIGFTVSYSYAPPFVNDGVVKTIGQPTEVSRINIVFDKAEKTFGLFDEITGKTATVNGDSLIDYTKGGKLSPQSLIQTVISMMVYGQLLSYDAVNADDDIDFATGTVTHYEPTAENTAVDSVDDIAGGAEEEVADEEVADELEEAPVAGVSEDDGSIDDI